jgi:hypothetical protein
MRCNVGSKPINLKGRGTELLHEDILETEENREQYRLVELAVMSE